MIFQNSSQLSSKKVFSFISVRPFVLRSKRHDWPINNCIVNMCLQSSNSVSLCWQTKMYFRLGESDSDLYENHVSICSICRCLIMCNITSPVSYNISFGECVIIMLLLSVLLCFRNCVLLCECTSIYFACNYYISCHIVTLLTFSANLTISFSLK